MFEGIDFDNWKKTYQFKTTKEKILKIKYSHRWYFPAMLFMMLALVFSFLLFVISFFTIINSNPVLQILYSVFIVFFAAVWLLIYLFIQNISKRPFESKSEGFLILTKDKITIKKKNNPIKEYEYKKIKKIIFNRKICSLTIMDTSKKIIFNEILDADYVFELLNFLFEITKIKPKIL